jgi:hypothetical protein
MSHKTRILWKDHDLQDEEGDLEIVTLQIYEAEAPAYATKTNGINVL